MYEYRKKEDLKQRNEGNEEKYVNKESTADVEVFPDCESTTQMLI
jgi:hypothetical protein